MISERKFVRVYNGFWAQLLPQSEETVRWLNLKRKYYDDGVESRAPPEHRALINELAFRVFGCCVKDDKNSWDEGLGRALVAEKYSEVREFIIELGGDKSPEVAPCEELEEALGIARSLWKFFYEERKECRLTVWPRFRGCGVLSSAQGDVMAGSKLYEVKGGARGVRSVDLRQVVLYAALAYLGDDRRVSAVVVVNPREGYWTGGEMIALIERATGRDLIDVYSQIANFLAEENTSR